MAGSLLGEDLGYPEGPVVMPDGRLVFCDSNTGELLVYANERIETFVRTGGSPWGACLGADGAIYVTQGGNVPESGDRSAISGIQRVAPGGEVELCYSEVSGHVLYGPNDLAFGPDGRLHFTDSGTEEDFRFDVRQPGRLFAVGGGRDEMLAERPGGYPNGLAFDAEGRLYWTETAVQRIMRLEDGEPVVFCQLPASNPPDGMAFAADGRAFVATTVSGGVTVVSPEGTPLEHIELGVLCTNCAFSGSRLYVTATRTPDLHAHERTGTLWEVETDTTGLPLFPGLLP